MADTGTARTVGHDTLTGWYQLSTDPETARAEAEMILDEWPNTRAPREDRRAA